MSDRYLTVSLLNKYIKRKFTADPYLGKIYLSGEISNFRLRARHQYFSLKDENAKIDVVMFASDFNKIKFVPEEGMKVLVSGYVDVYEASGRYQFYIKTMEPDGVGALYQAYEQLKRKLEQEGLFSAPKKVIPQFPQRIAVITSPSGAVIKDIITTTRRRYPIAQIVLFPAEVQGERAADSLVARLKEVNLRGDFDTIIIGRGGGSIEDLWPFNEEKVARAIFASAIPVISSVGHQTDTTIADLVADRRAATPTAAAELATPVLEEVLIQIARNQQTLFNIIHMVLQQHLRNWQKIQQSYIFKQPGRLYDSYLQKVDYLDNSLKQNFKHCLAQRKTELISLLGRIQVASPQQQLELVTNKYNNLVTNLGAEMNGYLKQRQDQLQQAVTSLDMLSPLKVLGRGYTYVKKDDQVIKTVSQLNVGEELSLHFQDGAADVEVRKIKGAEK
ncbi:exodeoxyribonuclease VII large subunit [Ligilactobacillus saerimneri]|uniref:Exodeoxyribonuclease 7 large subunit n=2 Tax=Ligilactobacillus saerimneri TaxID=228229 RepID=M5J4N2_9LACO|nr:exodeoxyribonuclease VII large subunit [Ligilactobacillus saerimneri]EKW98631.1 exodeoxyribonuclease VII large subunit [Ligilactobacillus saerimneri 30a]MDY4003274.1 exodeoxyribonuclease VII large subunit [Ligilactobacillus saerimneri]QLL77853.1 exodeoxyribonuclease VII large subunit [Ligilactobacillus saerimneri]